MNPRSDRSQPRFSHLFLFSGGTFHSHLANWLICRKIGKMELPESIPFSSVDEKLPVSQGDFRDFAEDPIAEMRKLYAEHGSLALLQDGFKKVAFAFGPVWNQPVLSNAQDYHSMFFAIRGSRNSSLRRLTSGLLSMNEDEHREHRRMLMGPFARKSFEKYFEGIDFLTAEMLNSWKVGDEKDILAEMTQFMLRVTSGMLFGLDNPEFAYKLGHMLHEWVQMNHEIGTGAFVADSKYTERYQDLLTLSDELEVQLKRLLEMKRQNPGDGKDVLSILMKAYQEEDAVDDAKLMGHIALLFAASHLTTAHTFTWTFLLLSQHPSVMQELHTELQAGVLSNPLNPNSTETSLDRILKESMRVLPASAYSQRICARDMTLGPLQLTMGTPVVFSQYMTHHMSALYPNPDQFQPERWLDIKPSPYAYLPFGTGPRMCIGGPLAMVILKMVIPKILSRFKLSTVPNSTINGRVISTMLTPTSTVPLLLEEQDGNFTSAPIQGSIHNLVHLPSAGKDAIRHAA
ncbi:Pentalenene oxygenase [Polystyrenella longa]|uniref:Pentalenene oxygenase n=1 Tax=Polystyrenella longa TaxID=2528007 RepID=A0A518CQG6_9PLAN|nr:cytochrome P450 [Polystyrenella longa]QDU81444.1 Pentalenene oxygenase [Polystyrenella longa]